jgi:hypothetical protein
VQRRRPNPRVRRAAQQEPDRHDDGPLSGRGESTGRYARIYAGRPPSPAGDGPATDAAGRDRRRRPCVIPVVGGLADFVGCVGGEVAEQAEHLWRILLTEHAGNTVLATGPADAKWK